MPSFDHAQTRTRPAPRSPVERLLCAWRVVLSRLVCCLCVLASGSALSACKARPTSGPHPLSVRASDQRLADVPNQAVSGSLRGAPFRVVDARVRVESREGRERVDVYLSETPIERCGLPLARHGRRVWLRFAGKPVFDGAELRVEAGARGAFEPHYEVELDGHWLGHGGGAALVALSDDGFGEYKGQLWTCFDDGLESCVTGHFQATACRSELDVDDSVWGAGRLEAQPPKRSAP